MEYFAEAGHPVYVFNPLGTLIQAGCDTGALQNSPCVTSAMVY